MVLNPPVLLLTRPKASSLGFAQAVNPPQDTRVVISPLLRIAFLREAPAFDAAIFTSKNGVESAGNGLGRQAYCVGEKTALAAKKAGFQTVATAQNAQDLVTKIVSNPPQASLLHIRGEYAIGDIMQNLRRASIECDACVTYRQVAQSFRDEVRQIFEGDQRIVAPIFSPRTATLFVDQVKSLPLVQRPRALEIVGLSAQVTGSIPREMAQKITVCQQPTGGCMLQLVSSIFND
jgi:uroporphyrinogen-III synthase